MIEKLDSQMNCIEISVLGTKKAECLDFEDAKTMGRKINELVDAVNKLQESVQGVVDNSIKDGAYIQNLEEDVKVLRDDCNLLMGYIAPEDGCKPTDEDLREMVKDPKYWKEQDPETVREVELAFQKKYGETTQNSTNNVKNSHLFQGNEQKPVCFVSTTFLSDNQTTVFYGQNGVSVEFNQPLPAGFIITIKENETKGGKDE